VSWKKRTKKWNVQICHNGKSKTIGSFDNEIEAAKAYDEVARKYHKEFAVLNFESPQLRFGQAKRRGPTPKAINNKS